jgi:hypothetical protein
VTFTGTSNERSRPSVAVVPTGSVFLFRTGYATPGTGSPIVRRCVICWTAAIAHFRGCNAWHRVSSPVPEIGNGWLAAGVHENRGFRETIASTEWVSDGTLPGWDAMKTDIRL